MFERELPPALRERAKSLEAWAVAGFKEKDVRILARALESAFYWKQGDAFRLRPNDRLWEIYWYYYPKARLRAGGSDELDLETLALLLGRVSDPEAQELKLPTETTIGELAEFVAARPDRECSCGCHQGVHMFHPVACCLHCQGCGIAVGRGRHHQCAENSVRAPRPEAQ